MFKRFRKAGDFDKEVEAHLLLEADRLREHGLSETEALLAARRRFGNPTRAREQLYESRRWFFLGVLRQDVRFGMKMLGKSPSATAAMIFTLALALGVTTAIFSVFNAALLRLLPVRNADKLVMLTDPNASMVLGGMLTGKRSLLTYPEFARLRDQMKTLAGVCAAQLTLERWPIEIAGSSQEQVSGRLVSENYFTVFAVKPAIGRFFTKADAKGVGKDPYAVLSYDYWQRRFGGSSTILGRRIRLHRNSVVIIGVAAKGFRGETVGQDPNLWLPMLMQPLMMTGELARKLREIAGVSAVSYSGRGIFNGFEGAFPIVSVDGFTPKKEVDRGSTGDSAGPGYFATIGIPILSGREFTLRDEEKTPRVCVINEAFADRFFGGVNPIGKHLTTVLSDDDGKSVKKRLEVIGVAGNARVQSLRGPIDPKFYFPGGGPWFEVRTTGDPQHWAQAVRRAILAVNPELAIQSIRTLRQTLRMQNAQSKLITELAAFFGVLALMIAAVGVYGLLSYSVARRTNEIGIRVALGADRKRILAMILKETAILIGTGVITGAAATFIGARLLATELYGLNAADPRWSLAQYERVESAARLYGVNAMDPVTIGAAAGILCVLGMIAGSLPAARAARVDPVNALRNE